MSTEDKSTIYRQTVNDVPDDMIDELYYSDLIYNMDIHGAIKHFVPMSQRRLDFFQSATAVGLELAAGPLINVRLFLVTHLEQPSGYASEYEGQNKRGILRTFNNEGKIQHMSGHWAQDDATGQQVFIKSEHQSFTDLEHTSKKQADRTIYALAQFFAKHLPVGMSPA